MSTLLSKINAAKTLDALVKLVGTGMADEDLKRYLTRRAEFMADLIGTEKSAGILTVKKPANSPKPEAKLAVRGIDKPNFGGLLKAMAAFKNVATKGDYLAVALLSGDPAIMAAVVHLMAANPARSTSHINGTKCIDTNLSTVRKGVWAGMDAERRATSEADWTWIDRSADALIYNKKYQFADDKVRKVIPCELTVKTRKERK